MMNSKKIALLALLIGGMGQSTVQAHWLFKGLGHIAHFSVGSRLRTSITSVFGTTTAYLYGFLNKEQRENQTFLFKHALNNRTKQVGNVLDNISQASAKAACKVTAKK